MSDMTRPIEEKLLGEVMIGLQFYTGQNAEFQDQRVRVALYDCPSDRRAIVKDVRAIWSPDNPWTFPLEDQMGGDAAVNDKRFMLLLVNQTGVIKTFATDADVPEAIQFPNLMGGSASSIVMEPGERLELGINVEINSGASDVADWIAARVSGVEVQI